MATNDPILNSALHDLLSLDESIQQAERILNVLSTAGEPTTVQQGNLSQLKVRRQKLVAALKAQGALDEI